MKKSLFLLLIMCLLVSFASVTFFNARESEASIRSPNITSVTKEIIVNLSYTDSGWYEESGSHTPDNLNYLVGKCGAPYCIDGAAIFRNFFVFDLAPVPGTILTATLEVENHETGFESSQPSETWTIYEVSTPVNTLVTSTSSEAIYADLGSGTVFGSAQVSAASNGELVTVPLNNDAVSALNAAIGNTFAVGGALTTLEANDQTEWVFASTNNADYVRRLVVTAEFEATEFVFLPTMVRD